PGDAGRGVPARRVSASATTRAGPATGKGGTSRGRGADLPAVPSSSGDGERHQQADGGPGKTGPRLRAAGSHGGGTNHSAVAIGRSNLGSPLRWTRFRRGGRGRPEAVCPGVDGRRAGA